MIRLEASRGRVHLKLTAQQLGRDLCVTLTGGDREHIGAVALARPGEEEPGLLAVPGHREDALARETAARLSAHLKASVCVACGIHLDQIQKSEIVVVLELCRTLTRTLMDRLDPLHG